MTQVYDIGIHYIPDDVSAVESFIKTLTKSIETTGGTILSSDEPNQVDLTFEIRGKQISKTGTYPRYTQSFFFTIRCEVEDIQPIDAALEKDANVIRHITVKTNAEDGFVDPDLYRKPQEEEKKKEDSDGTEMFSESEENGDEDMVVSAEENDATDATKESVEYETENSR